VKNQIFENFAASQHYPNFPISPTPAPPQSSVTFVIVVVVIANNLEFLSYKDEIVLLDVNLSQHAMRPRLRPLFQSNLQKISRVLLLPFW